ncbi:FAD-dependent monooxygenase [Vineibacter terrae]|uniref:FAD-dependent monooxygenase n=1 Tax=Vineibacter terrae TaxID=2586908 RepID=UPI002E30723B|nr:FAD-dependent monooxygenase [Vineibacter terrae]HEX2891742.1 FAD-dependent monooxygenase [Vineibacter terrae]
MSLQAPIPSASPAAARPVLIVGAGPVGLMMAILLARLGIHSVVVERRQPRQSSAPKAHVINPRSLEICRSAGLDVAEMYARGTPHSEGHHVRFVETLVGYEFGVLALDDDDVTRERLTPTPLLNLAQPAFEAILERAAAQLPEIAIRRGHTWIACEAKDGGIESTVEADGSTYRLASAYLIAADGANSAVRDHLAIEMDGDPAVRARVTIHFDADLRHIVRDRPGILYWVFDAAAAGTFIAYDAASTWVYSPRAIPATFDRAEFSDAYCEALIKRAIGTDDVRLSIKHVVPWMMAAQVAKAYRRGNCFLVGDAAHRFPPTGGLGLNTGLQDAHNLAWKIAAVERGLAGGALLDTYEQERLPIAQINTRQSLSNASRLPHLFKMAQSALAQPAITAQAAHEIRAEIETHREHFLSTGLQLGFSYGPPVQGPADPTRYEPSIAPGARLPHAWLRHEGQRLSTLDLAAFGAFTLLTGAQAPAWGQLAARTGHVRHVAIDPTFQLEAEWLASGILKDGGAVLVRPDGHIGACVPDASPQSQRQISAALDLLLPS